MATGTETVQELISVSILENLDQDDENYESLKFSLGPSLREELKNYE
jgi:hypothetical protein